MGKDCFSTIGWLVVLPAIIAALFLAPMGLLFVAIVLFSQRTIFERVPSPDGWQEARVQFDDAGAVSSFSRLVFVKYRWNLSDEPLLSCRAFWAEGEDPVHLRWLNSRTLIIDQGFAPQAVQAVAPQCGGTRIIVRQLSPPPREDIGVILEGKPGPGEGDSAPVRGR